MPAAPRRRSAGIYLTNRGLDGLIDSLDRLSKPDHNATMPLEAALAAGFAVTQAEVHVISGRLKASGRTSSDFDGETWTGKVEYGGPEGTPAYYAIYELNRPGTRPDGTPHDFLRGMDAVEPMIESAFDSWFDRSLR